MQSTYIFDQLRKLNPLERSTDFEALREYLEMRLYIHT